MITIKINDLNVLTTLGVYDWEQAAKRSVLLNIELSVDCDEAGWSDDIKDAVDYAVLEEKIISHLENSSYFLLEKLVADIGNLLLLMDSRIKKVKIEAEKAGALRQAKSVSVLTEFLA